MKRLYVGDTGEYLSFEAKKDSSSATLVTSSNYKKFLSATSGVFYTSLGDINDPKKFTDILLGADQVIYSPHERWSDAGTIVDARFTCETETKEFLYQLSWVTKKPVKNLPLNVNATDFSNLTNIKQRVSERPQMWNTGCSITAGNGVKPNERYGEVLAGELGLPLKVLAYEGASISWAGDQILLSDVKQGDIVVWGITSPGRYSYVLHNQKFYHTNAMFYLNYPLMEQIVDIDWLDSPNNVFEAFNKINQVQNFCNKAGAKLYMIGFLTTDQMDKELSKRDNYIACKDPWIDKGTDNMHPGIKQHSKFARVLKELINDR